MTTAAPRTVTAPVLLLGPRSRGRSYGVLRRSPGPEPDSATLALLNDFALSLAGWAGRNQGGFAACFPTPDGGVALARAERLGEAELGAVGQAAVVLLGPDAAAEEGLHRLIGRLPDAADPEVGKAAVRLPLDGGEAIKPIPNTGLAWADQVIGVDGDASGALQALIEGVYPPAQKRRVRGWATTADLPEVGSFRPAELFQLMTHPGAPRRATGSISGGVLTSKDPPPPASWQAWSALARSPATRFAADAAPWNPSWAETPAADVVAFAGIEACKRLDTAGRVELLRGVAALADASEGAVSEGLQGGYTAILDALSRAGEPAAAADYLGGLLSGPVPEAGLRGAAAAAAAQAVLQRLSPDEVARLAGAGLVDALAGQEWTSPSGLRDLNPAVLGVLARAALSEPGEEARTLAPRLIAAEARTAGFAEDLDALMRLPRHAADTALARSEVVEAVVDARPEHWSELVARAVRPALRTARDPAAFKQALAAALAAEKAGSAAA